MILIEKKFQENKQTTWAQFTTNDISLGTPRTALLLCFVSVDDV